MRAFSSSVMAALIVVALFWGNCFSCPQLLLEQNPHQCCHPQKRAMSDCGTQNLQQFVRADLGMHAPAMPVVALVSLPVSPVDSSPVTPAPEEHAPPGFVPLHSILRV